MSINRLLSGLFAVSRPCPHAEASVLDLSSLALKLSRNTAGRASISAAVNRLSNSFASWPLVKADGLTPLATMQTALSRSPFPLPAPL